MAKAKAKLSELVDQAATGKTVVIAKAGLPMARLVPLGPLTDEDQVGVLAGTLSSRAITILEAPLEQDTIDLMNCAPLLTPKRP